MPGFTSREREFIANLCRYHRKSLPAASRLSRRSLNNGDGRALLRLVPLLRIADGLDRSHRQRIRSLACDIRPGEVRILVDSPAEVDLELWAADQAGEVFRQVYGRSVKVLRQPR